MAQLLKDATYQGAWICPSVKDSTLPWRSLIKAVSYTWAWLFSAAGRWCLSNPTPSLLQRLCCSLPSLFTFVLMAYHSEPVTTCYCRGKYSLTHVWFVSDIHPKLKQLSHVFTQKSHICLLSNEIFSPAKKKLRNQPVKRNKIASEWVTNIIVT